MKWNDIEDWAKIVDREIMALRGNGRTTVAAEEAIAVLDTSFAELHAASEEIRSQSTEMERVLLETASVRRRHEVLLDMVSEAVLETDGDGVIRTANPAAASLLGVRADYLARKPLLLFVAEDDRQIFNNCLRALRKGDSVKEWEMRLQPRRAPAIPTRTSVQVAIGDMSRESVLVWVVRNATDLSSNLQAWRSTRDDLDKEIETRTQVVHDLETAMHDRLAGLRKLARRVVDLEELEGHKLARDLRERFGQALGAVRINMASLSRHVPGLEGQPLYRESVMLVDIALKNLRALYFELGTPMLQGAGLVSIVRQLIGRMPNADRLNITLEADELPALPPDVESACLWCVREALNNVIRHAGASRVHLTIRREVTRLFVEITDDGRGFDLASTRPEAEKAGCFGLVGMEERVAILGGDVEVRSTPGEGTLIRLAFIAPPL